jgi:hypothetical protein
MDRDLEEFIRWIAQLNGGDVACARDWFYGAPLVELGGDTAASYLANGMQEAVRRYVLNLMAGSTG